MLTHGFALDQQRPQDVQVDRQRRRSARRSSSEIGADILRLWVASTDYFEDVRIGKEVLATTTDAYRKLRNTFRYLLGALDGFDDAEKVAPAEMPELERWVLHRLAELDAELREAADGFEFNRYARRSRAFANDDLSAFFFDIRKDSLYCDAPTSPKRRAYRTVLDIVFHALVRWLAPILCFTAEEVWQTRFPDERLGPSARMAGDRRRLARRRAGREMGRDPRHPRAGDRDDRAAAAREGDRLEPRGAGRLFPRSELDADRRETCRRRSRKSTSCPKSRRARARRSR